MEIWLLVIILLVIAIILLVASLFTKNETDVEEQINELVYQQSQEINALKTRIQELETSSNNYYNKDISQNFTENVTTNPQNEENIVEVNEENRQTIITMYTQGYTMQEIQNSVGLDAITIQSIVDDYIENR